MNIFTLIKKDHDEARELMETIMASKNDPEACENLCEELKVAILAHAKSEEKIFYTALKETGDEELEEKVPHMKKEHKTVEALFEKIGTLEASDPLWWECFGEIRRGLLHHMEEEEKEVFKDAKLEIPSNEAKDLGTEMESVEDRMKVQLQQQAA